MPVTVAVAVCVRPEFTTVRVLPVVLAGSLLATARPLRPVPMKLPAAIATGAVPVESMPPSVNVPSPLPNRMLTVLSVPLTTARSR